MSRRKAAGKDGQRALESLDKALWRMVLTLVVPMLLLLAITFSSEIIYINRYNQVLNNVTKASEFNQNFKNLTRNHQYEFDTVEIGVTYGTDVAHARRLILQALRHLPGLSPQHTSYVTLKEFADSCVTLNICVWVPVKGKPIVMSRVREAIYKTFNDNGIEIPFPQQDLYIKPLPGAENPFPPQQ